MHMSSSTMPSVLWRCWLGGRKGIQSVKIWGDCGGGHWLVWWSDAQLDGCCLPLLIFPCTIKSRSSLLAAAHPSGPGKRAVKRLWSSSTFILLYTSLVRPHLNYEVRLGAHVK